MDAGIVERPTRTILERENEQKVILDSCDKVSLIKDDLIIIKTPGGGGYGRSRS